MTEVSDLGKITTEAQAAYDKGEFLKAAEGFHSAACRLSLSGEEKKSAEMANNCCVAYLQAGEPQLALESIDGKEDIFEQTDDQHYLAMTIGNRGAGFDALGKMDEALNAYQFSADIFKIIGDQELYTSTMQAISSMQLRRGRPRDAVISMQEGISQFPKNGLKWRIIKTLIGLPNKILDR